MQAANSNVVPRSSQVLAMPITEMSNSLTSEIDLVSSEGMVRLLRQSDAQLFSGFLDLPNVYEGTPISFFSKDLLIGHYLHSYN